MKTNYLYNGYIIISDYTNKLNTQSLEQAANEWKIRKIWENQGIQSFKIMKYQIPSIERKNRQVISWIWMTSQELATFLTW